MTRAISTATAAKIDSANAWEPGFLVVLTLANYVLRFSTRGDVTHAGNIYITAVLDVQNLLDDSSNGSLAFNDPSLAVQTLIRTESLIGKRVQIARFYEGATGSTDPIWFFEGYIQAASEGTPPGITLTVSRNASRQSLTPNKRIGRASGFNVMVPEGQIVRFRQSIFHLERAKR